MFRQLRHRQTKGAANSRVGANITAPHLDSTPSAMPLLHIRIVFSALLGSSPIESHTVSLGGVYPDIEIEDTTQPNGLHYFKIWKTVPHHGSQMLESAAAEATAEIESFWHVLSYLRDVLIQPTGVVQYEHDGQLRPIGRPPRPQSSATLTAGSGAKWFEINAEAFHRRYNYDLLKRLNFARSLKDPVSRFLSLYAMLASVAEDQQPAIDRLIRAEEPTVASSQSPKHGRPETIFTRLRNELAHHRDGVSVFATHEEIDLHVGRFEWLVTRILHSRLEGA